MTAVLSPEETEEVTRFGIHETEIIAWMEDQFTPKKCMACDTEAVCYLVTTCCGVKMPVCDEHLRFARERLVGAAWASCTACRRFTRQPTFEGLYRVEPLS